MEWWQIILVILLSIVTGGGVGALFGYSVLQFKKRRGIMQVVNEIVSKAVNENMDTTAYENAKSKHGEIFS